MTKQTPAAPASSNVQPAPNGPPTTPLGRAKEQIDREGADAARTVNAVAEKAKKVWAAKVSPVLHEVEHDLEKASDTVTLGASNVLERLDDLTHTAPAAPEKK